LAIKDDGNELFGDPSRRLAIEYDYWVAAADAGAGTTCKSINKHCQMDFV